MDTLNLNRMVNVYCAKEINLSVMGSKSDYVADHDHITGEIRGVLCRGCNGSEGKVFTAVLLGVNKDSTQTM